MKKLVYIAGPFSPSNGKTMKENTEFAERVGRYAQALGYAPVVPHSSILRQVYGDDALEHDRIEGTLSTLTLMMAIMDSPESELWVISDGLNELSSGTQEEYNIWLQNREESSITIKKDWQWEREIREFWLEEMRKLSEGQYQGELKEALEGK